MEQKTKNCPYCGEEILAIAKKCKYCGEWLTEEKTEETSKQMIPCPICGEMIEDGTEICPYCHEKLTKTSNPAADFIKPIKAEKKEDNTRSFFDYYLWDPFFRHYFDFKGRLNRKHYWISILVLYMVLVAIFCIPYIGYLVFLLFILSIIPQYATAARRMRDGDSEPGLLGWISLFFPTILWWLVKPTEYRMAGMEDAEPDTPQTIKFKKVDKIICLIYVILLIIGVSALYLNEKKNSPSSEQVETEQKEVIVNADSEESLNNSDDDFAYDPWNGTFVLDGETYRGISQTYVLLNLNKMSKGIYEGTITVLSGHGTDEEFDPVYGGLEGKVRGKVVDDYLVVVIDSYSIQAGDESNSFDNTNMKGQAFRILNNGSLYEAEALGNMEHYFDGGDISVNRPEDE